MCHHLELNMIDFIGGLLWFALVWFSFKLLVVLRIEPRCMPEKYSSTYTLRLYTFGFNTNLRDTPHLLPS